MWFKREKHLVYFDFGHRFIKMAYVTKHGQNLTIHKINIQPTPKNCIRSELPENNLTFKEALNELVKPIPDSTLIKSQFLLSAPDAHTVLKKISLPQPLPKDLDSHILYEAEQIAPYPIQDAFVDYTVLNDKFFAENPNQKQSSILVTIAQKSSIRPFTSLFEESDFNLSFASPASVGLMNIGLRMLQTGSYGSNIAAHTVT